MAFINNLFHAQYWMLSKTGEIRRDESCLDYSGTDVILYPCHGSKGNQQWTYNTQVWTFAFVLKNYKTEKIKERE